MAKTNFFYGALLSGTMISGMFGTFAFAADMDVSGGLPAVSAVNGKVEFEGGWADSDLHGDDTALYGGAALSVPLGQSFGFQGDIAIVDVFGETAIGAAGHLFTRDPSAYLFGAIGGYMHSDSADMLWGGAEAELYLGNITLRGLAGVSDSDVTGGGNSTDFLATAELALYATENLKLQVGGTTVAGFESATASMEWMMQEQLGMPMSFKADASVGENGFVSAMAGVAFYFGGNEQGKSLMRRHREDDPEITAFAGASAQNIFGAGVLSGGGAPASEEPEGDCAFYEENYPQYGWEYVDGEGCVRVFD